MELRRPLTRPDAVKPILGIINGRVMASSPTNGGPRLRPADSVHTRMFDGELVILDLAAGEYLSLDAIGTLLWNGLLEGRTLEQIAGDVVATYAVSLEQAMADLDALKNELLEKKLMIVETEGAT